MGFLDTDPTSPIFAINRYVDAVFFFDTILQFFLPYTGIYNNVVYNKRLIAKRYLKGWAFVDFVSLAPFDIIAASMQSSGNGLEQAQAIRMVRLLRLVKLLRILRGTRVLKRWEARLNLNYMLMNLGMLVVTLLLMAHWLACSFGLVILVFRLGDDAWVKSFPWLGDIPPDWVTTEEDVGGGAGGGGLAVSAHSGVPGSWDLYVATMTWSVGLITGFGGTISSDNLEEPQRIYHIFVYVVAGIGNAYLIGGVVGMLERMQERRGEFYSTMHKLNK